MDTTIGIKVTADTAQAQSAMGAFSNAVGAVNITSLAEQVKALESNLNAATPKNMAFAETFNKIQADLAAGTISLDEAREAVNKLSEEMGHAPEPVEKTTMSLADFKAGLDMAIGVAQKAGEVFQAAFDMAKEGATIEQTHESLDRMATSAGVASDLLGRLEAAAGGTVDDLVLAGGASRLMAGQSQEMARALGNAAPELVTISRAMAKLSPTVGDSTAAFEALTEAMQTGRTRGLQQWGFDITKIKDDQDLLNQILDQGRGLVSDLGGDVESATDKYARFEQGIDNLNDALVTFIANSEATNTVIQGLTDNLDGTNTVIALHAQGVISTADAWRLWAGLQIPSELEATKAELEGLVMATMEQERETQRLMNATTSATQAQTEANATGEAAVTTYSEMALAYSIAANAINEAKVANEKLNTESTLLKDALSKLATEGLNPAAAAANLLKDGINLASDSMVEAERVTMVLAIAEKMRQLNTEDMTDAQKEQVSRELELLLNQQTEIENMDKINELLRSGKIDRLDWIQVMADGIVTQEEINGLLGVEEDKLIEVNKQINNIPEYKKFTLEVNVTGDQLPNVGGYGGGHPTGPTTPTASQRVGGEMPLPGDMGDTDWQAVFMSLTNEQQRAVQDMVGDSMYEADYARAITKVLKKGDLTDLARKLGGRGGRTLPRGDGGGGAHPMPTSGGFAVADGAGNVIYANTLVIYATNAELNAENGGDNFAMFSQKVGA